MRRLIEHSAVARALWEEAADLDRLLDAVPAEAPSAALSARVLAAAPPRPSARLWWRRAVAAMVPLVAAAAITLWIATRREATPPKMANVPATALGEYTSPTDVLLEPYGVDVYAIVPSIGCSDSVLGCPNLNAAGRPYSKRSSSRRLRA